MRARIIHVGKMDKFILPYYDLVQENFPKQEHAFYFFSDKSKFQGDVENRDLLITDLGSLLKLIRGMYTADKIILHSMFSQQIFFLLLIQPWLIKKCYWFMWGGDLYYKFIHSPGVVTSFLEFFRSLVLKKILYTISGVEGDYELMKNLYNPNAVFCECLGYESNVFWAFKEARKDSQHVNVLIGNSAARTNNHLELFQMIKPMMKPGIKLYVPLSYGDLEYSREIQRIGQEMFGDAFIPITTFMSFKDYLLFLNEIDIAILGHDRQQAFGNTITLLGYGKKVFMKSSVTTWKTFQKLGVKVFDLNQLTLDPAFAENQNNKELIEAHFTKKKLIDQWRVIFDR